MNAHRLRHRVPGPVGAALVVMVAAVIAGLGVVAGSAAGLPVGSQPLAPYRTCVLTATPSTTTVVADAEVRQGSPSTNYGTATTLTVTSSGSFNRRAHVRFDLTSCSPAIPTTAIVRQATLRLYVTALPAVCRTLDLFDATATWTESGITWNNQPFGTTLNNPASGTRSASVDVGTPVGCANRSTATYVSVAGLTADVQAFVTGSTANFGWMIRDDVEGSATARTATFSAKNLGTLAQAPQLIVTYVAVP